MSTSKIRTSKERCSLPSSLSFPWIPCNAGTPGIRCRRRMGSLTSGQSHTGFALVSVWRAAASYPLHLQKIGLSSSEMCTASSAAVPHCPPAPHPSGMLTRLGSWLTGTYLPTWYTKSWHTARTRHLWTPKVGTTANLTVPTSRWGVQEIAAIPGQEKRPGAMALQLEGRVNYGKLTLRHLVRFLCSTVFSDPFWKRRLILRASEATVNTGH